MIRKIFPNFLKDNMVFIIGFFVNSMLLVLFYSLSTDWEVEVLYPAAVSVFVFVVLIIVKWARYCRFNMNLQKCIENVSYELQPVTCEQKEASKAINSIHHKYLQKITEINNLNTTQRHFISQWVHNMKTPVSVIDLILKKGLLKNSETENKPDDMNTMLEDLNEENTKLNNILEQIMNIIRLEDFAKDYVPEPVDLAASVRSVINSKKNQFIYSNIFPQLQYVEGKTTVLSDRKWNELIIDQLVSNAIKYSGSGETSRKIRFIIEHRNETTCLTIKDEGIGIPAYDLKKVLEPFFTGENGRKCRNATGIGLYICSVAAKRLGHTLTIESDVGKGTSVTISYLSKL